MNTAGLIAICVLAVVSLLLMLLFVATATIFYKKKKQYEELIEKAKESAKAIDELNSCDLNSSDLNDYYLQYVSRITDNLGLYSEFDNNKYSGSFMALAAIKDLATFKEAMCEKAQENKILRG
jgi:hypothetical protein